MKQIFIFLIISLFLATTSLLAQVRPAERVEDPNKNAASQKKMLKSIAVKYKGGLLGFSKSQKGTLKFDTINERLVFYSKKDGKEKFSIPYQSMIVIYPSQKRVQSGTGRAIGAIPFPGAGIGGSFIKKKKNYMVIQYNDPDVKTKGAVNFLVDTGELLMSAIYSVGENAEMKARGDAYIRKNDF